ncbi:3-deoxy-manno-octulosonate cytidylyltransferase [Algimonas ampicilliniresistens]|jgi:3-deoxy-manno-octulosonate cytidylyltransferase (CMP-KDO synthetase)|uniref:3-deoxy-manno-octulosonate cytidylyltransferase n=1 Tax=Algimonas ampicilliniresistens TaxID=1298735 RepID=A0ABQ5V8Q2_9PROT|nr:manno-octulosonate cytidylyltransferase [Algimonas ampicilliniresistens]GLQ23921.1 3-deoxy-manno-octulosonate cytidylyltransferase [Algimonas ampicilliniresistens]
MKPLIVIPARYASTRFPGKPLAEIGGIAMLERTAMVAHKVGDFVVATDDDRIEDFCRERDLPVVMTDPDLLSGSDRAKVAADLFDPSADLIVNLQGDAPFTPPAYVQACLDALTADPSADISTPVVALSWDALDELRDAKKATPFSGTCAIVGDDGRARWFSKNIIPAIRKESSMREENETSPVLQHVGLYAYRRAALARYVTLPPSPYEQLEGLEQLRALENGLTIACARVDSHPMSQAGIDTPEDLARAEARLASLS